MTCNSQAVMWLALIDIILLSLWITLRFGGR